MNKIITIDRQFGSGGREIGRRLSEKLGYAYYDHEIISEIAKKTELAEAYVKHIVEHSPFQSFPITIGKTFYHYGSNAVMEQNNTIYTEQRNIILGMAETSDCIIVGRCADYVLSENENRVSIFLYGDMDCRITRIMERHDGVDEDEAKKLIAKTDKRRMNYYNFYTGKKWGKFDNYHLSLNTSVLGIDGSARIIAEFVKNIEAKS